MTGGGDYLLFRLAGPLAAWGDITVGEIRSTWDRPSKSAVLGLVAAALGLERRDEAGHAALHEGLGFAVRPDGGGAVPLRDFHTAQVPSTRKGQRWRTRAEELAAPRDTLNTIVSERWYWAGAAATAALWPRGGKAPALTVLAEALRRPRYTPYLGRKACPLGWPLHPRLLSAASLPAAFAAFDAAERSARESLPPHLAEAVAPGGHCWAEAEELSERSLERQVRRDSLVHREAWIFADREEARIPLGEGI